MPAPRSRRADSAWAAVASTPVTATATAQSHHRSPRTAGRAGPSRSARPTTPGQRTLRIADGAREVRGAEQHAGDAVRGARALDELGRDGGDGRERPPGGREGEPHRDRTGDRQARCAKPGSDQHRHEKVGCAGDEQRCSERGVSTDGRRARSSRRPASSSARVWRTMVSRLMSAITTAPMPVSRHAVSPPIVVANSGPISARRSGCR